MAEITPERGYVLVHPMDVDPVQMGKTKIVMPDTGREEPQFAQIVAIGKPSYNEDGSSREAPDYDVGDYCYFGKWQGLEFMIKGKTRKLVKQEHIYATVVLDADELETLKDKK